MFGKELRTDSACRKKVLANDASRLWVLDVVRAPALLAVIAFHAFIATNAQNLASDQSLAPFLRLNYGGAFGVSIFFFLSGFGTHYGVIRKAERGMSWRSFLVSRLRKLYPMYLAAILLSITVNLLWALLRGRNLMPHIPSFHDFFSHLLLLHTCDSSTFFGIIPALWFVGVLAQFYLLYPLYLAISRRWGGTRALLSVALVTSGFRIAAYYWGAGLDENQQMVLWMNAPTRWLEWVLGAWMAGEFMKGNRIHPMLGFLSLLLALVWLPVGAQWRLVYDPVLTTLLGFALWSFAPIGVGPRTQSILTPIASLAVISYPVYLVHQIFLPFIASAVGNLAIPNASIFTLIFLMTCLFSCLIAFLMHWFLVHRPWKSPFH